MLHHFRCILRGFLPFSVAKDNIEQLQTKESLDDDAVIYVKRILALIAAGGRVSAPYYKGHLLMICRQFDPAVSGGSTH